MESGLTYRTTEPLYLADARVLDLFQVGVVQGNVTVGIGVLSYAGQLNFSIRVSAGVVNPAQKQLRMRLRRTLPGFVAQSADDPRR